VAEIDARELGSQLMKERGGCACHRPATESEACCEERAEGHAVTMRG
jgi:hypothetical protein